QCLWYRLVYCTYDAFFFFSSRRRHTRSKRDWSSDVCSSDLLGNGEPCGLRRVLYVGHDGLRVQRRESGCGGYEGLDFALGRKVRSEERRVGKGWRSGWERGCEKKEEA